MNVFKRPAAAAALAVSLCVLMPGGTAQAVDFPGANTGAIPDNNPSGRDVTFNVSGFNGQVTDVAVNFTINHTFVGDLDVVLISPSGVARLVVFSAAWRSRAGTLGSGANLNGTYSFSDAAISDLWNTIGGQSTDFAVPATFYRTSTRGNLATLHGGCTTYLRGAFAGLSAAQTNGTWTLHFADLIGTDTGSVTGATLSITGNTTMFRDSLEDYTGAPAGSPTRGTCRRAQYDFTGTGASTYTVVRNTGGGPGGAVTWFLLSNSAPGAGAASNFILGDANDNFVNGDMDGDGIDDAGVWDFATRMYTFRRSSRPTDSPLRINFGQGGDEPTVIGDYDGDGVSDVAVYRNGASAGDPSNMIILLSRTGTVRQFVTGQNGHFTASGVDYTGDGIADAATQSNAGGGIARFDVFNGLTGTPVTNFTHGTPTDVIVIGNHVGSSVHDFTVTRSNAGSIDWSTRDGATGAVAATVAFGASATDFRLTGDYDGDGIDDYAVWRPSVTPGDSRFFIRRSLSPVTPLEVPHGQNGDYSIANGRAY